MAMAKQANKRIRPSGGLFQFPKYDGSYNRSWISFHHSITVVVVVIALIQLVVALGGPAAVSSWGVRSARRSTTMGWERKEEKEEEERRTPAIAKWFARALHPSNPQTIFVRGDRDDGRERFVIASVSDSSGGDVRWRELLGVGHHFQTSSF